MQYEKRSIPSVLIIITEIPRRWAWIVVLIYIFCEYTDKGTDARSIIKCRHGAAAVLFTRRKVLQKN